MPNTPEKVWEILRDTRFIQQNLNGIMISVPFYRQADTTVNGETIYFELDALGGNIREMLVSFYLPLHATATFTPRLYKTRPNDLVTFTLEAIPAMAAIVTPAANAYYTYSLGDLAQSLQMRFAIHHDNNVAAVSADAWLVALMEV